MSDPNGPLGRWRDPEQLKWRRSVIGMTVSFLYGVVAILFMFGLVPNLVMALLSWAFACWCLVHFGPLWRNGEH